MAGTEKQKEWVRKNRDRINAQQRERRKRHPELRREYERRHRERYPDKKKEKDARSYSRNRTARRVAQSVYSAAHRKEAISRVNLWRAANRAHANTINANRRARVAGAEGTHTVGEWENLKQQYGYRCNGCGKTEPEIKLTRDHIIPIARGGSNYIENIQPLCGKCNCHKHAKMPNEL